MTANPVPWVHIRERVLQVRGTMKAIPVSVVFLLCSSPVYSADMHDRINFTGVVEVETSLVDPYEGSHESDLVVATLAAGWETQISQNTLTVITLLYEQDKTDLEVDEAFLTVRRGQYRATVGQIYVPFGFFESVLINDPLTLELAETREITAMLGFEAGRISGHVLLFNGDEDTDSEDALGNWGFGFDFDQEGESRSHGFGLDFISNLAHSDNIRAAGFDLDDGAGGYSGHGYLSAGPLGFSVERIAVMDGFEAAALDFNDSGADPAVWHLEVTFGFRTMGQDVTAAIAYQKTEDALFLELPETRLSLGLSSKLSAGFALSLELYHDSDYAAGDIAGAVHATGKDANGVVVQLAAEI